MTPPLPSRRMAASFLTPLHSVLPQDLDRTHFVEDFAAKGDVLQTRATYLNEHRDQETATGQDPARQTMQTTKRGSADSIRLRGTYQSWLRVIANKNRELVVGGIHLNVAFDIRRSRRFFLSIGLLVVVTEKKSGGIDMANFHDRLVVWNRLSFA